MNIFASRLPESVIKQISVEVSKVHGVNLGQGIPALPTAPQILAAARDALVDPTVNQYPPFLGLIPLRQAIAARLNRQYQLQLDFERTIIVTVGAMEAMATAVLTILENDDRVAIITPDYANHFPQVTFARGIVVEIPMTPSRNGWDVNFRLLTAEAKRGLKLVILTNPSNPTGAVLKKTDLQQLVSLGQRYGFWILLDETYQYLVYDQPATSLLEFWNEYDRLLVACSFSKEFVMTGWRVGYLVSHPEYTSFFSRTHDGLVGCTPRISQIAALAALSLPKSYFEKQHAIYVKRRTHALKLLHELNEYLEIIPPQGAYYIFPKLKKIKDDRSFAQKLLLQEQLGVIPGSIFGAAGKGHIRLSFGVDENVFTNGIQKLTHFLTTEP